jgi:tRNA-Thr(GGU) m(6)t(6)A37 methyltransferase TsaA
MDSITVKPIGLVRSSRQDVRDDEWGDVVSVIELDAAQFDEEALAGLADFSHLEVIYHFHLVPLDKIETQARHPRNRADWPKVGIFSQRGKGRPNRLGLSRCRLLKVEGMTLTVQALDAVDGTPVLDIKPYMAEFGPIGPVSQPAWTHELMGNYYTSGV